MKEFPPFRLDPVNECLWRRSDGAEEQRILLSPKPFAMLRYLVEHAGRLVTQDELLEALWPETYVQPEVLKSHIRDLRIVLGDDSKNPRFIETLPRRGYQFIAAVSEGSGSGDLKGELAARRLVGRDSEFDRLRRALQRATQGQRQLVFVTGEAGIGKTALVDAFQRQAAADDSGLRIAWGECVEGYGGKEPYYPVLEALGQLCRGPGAESVVRILAAQAPTWLAQFPALKECEQHKIVDATRERMLREIADALETIAMERPMLLLFSNLHWADNSTVDMISALARRRQRAKLMLIATFRPVDVLLAEHPLNAVKEELLIHGLCQEIALEPLTETEVAGYLAMQAPGSALPEGLSALIYRHTEGNPLFMLAALEHMRERDLIAVENGAWQIKVPLEEIDLEVPESLRQMIELQIERLSAEEQHVLEVASVTGFSFAANANALDTSVDQEEFEILCEELSRRRHLVRRAGSDQFADGTISQCYEFAHAWYREVFYRRQAPARRAKLQLRIGVRVGQAFLPA